MPLYRYKCAVCRHEEDGINTIAQRETHAPQHCGQGMGIKIVPTQIHGDIEPYHCVVSGEVISSRSARREMMRKYNVVEAGDIDGRERERRRERVDAVRSSDRRNT